VENLKIPILEKVLAYSNGQFFKLCGVSGLSATKLRSTTIVRLETLFKVHGDLKDKCDLKNKYTWELEVWLIGRQGT